MAKGFLAGVIWGTVVTGVGASALSIMAEPPMPVVDPVADTDADAAEGDPVTQPLADASDTETPASAPDAEPAAPDAMDMTEAVQPSAEDAPVSAAPFAEGAVPEDAPDAPTQPEAEEAAIAAPQPQTGEAPDTVNAPSETAAPEAQALGGAPDLPGTPSAELPQAEVDPEAPLAETLSAAQPSPTLGEGIGDAPDAPDETPAADALAEVDPQPVTPDDAPALVPEPAPEDDPQADTASVEPTEDTGPRIGVRAGSLIDREPAVEQGRLPSLGQPVTQTEEDTAPETVALAADSPLVRNAEPVTVEDGVPQMSIILIDDGSSPMGPEELGTLRFPVSFAIAPGHPNAQAVAEGYRAKGFEVLALADLPAGAQASDVEVTLGGLTDLFPEAVGVLEDPNGSLQETRETAAQSAAYLKASGHGLVMQAKGMNTAQKLALREGVPSATLFRDLDGEGQDQSLIRRTLDQASFRARQEGAVVLLGRIRADTVSALVLWALQDRGNTIALVPISTVLRESVEQPD